MNFTKSEWSTEHKRFRELLKKEKTLPEAKSVFMNLHAMVHSGFTSGFSFENKLWDTLSDEVFQKATNKKLRTIAYGIWHSTRIEDMTMNLLVNNSVQILDRDNWMEKIGASIYDTGNALSPKEILSFSATIDKEQLRAYRFEVGKETRAIVENLSFSEIKDKVSQLGIAAIIEKGAVVQDEAAFWLIEYWKNKTVAGILLMPATRHLLVHITESMEAKKRGQKSFSM